MTLTKQNLVELVYERLEEYPKRQVAGMVEAFFDLIKEALVEGDSVLISGFGKFIKVYKNPRPGRNPKTGEEITIPGHYTVVFHPSPVLRKKING